MRTVDANKLKKHFESCARSYIPCESEWEVGAADAYTAMANLIDDFPTADAVPVVRCKECEYGDWDCAEEDALVCLRTNDGFGYSGNDFCSHGVRKEKNNAAD